MRFSLILVSCSLAAGLLGGCSGSTKRSGSSPVPESQFAARVGKAVCDNIGGCCKSAGYPYDAAKCEQAIGKNIAEFSSSPYTTYDAQAAGACLDSIHAATSSCKGFDVVDGTCQKAFVGNRAAGQACVAAGDCAPVAGADVSCQYAATAGGGGSAGAGQGTCVVKPIGKKGDGCDESCMRYGSVPVCTGGAALGNGGSSSGGARCYMEDGLYCGANGVCDALIPIGQPCPSLIGCVKGAYCDASGTCAADLPVGSPCTSYSSCKSTYCAGMAAGGPGTCANLERDGASCTTPDGCQGGLCQNGKCASPDYGVTADLCSGQSSSGGGGGSGGTGGGSGGMGGAFNGSGG